MKKIALAAFFVMAAIAAVVLLLPQNPASQTASLSGAPIPDDGFDKFTNTMHGFSLRYPKNWSIKPFLEGDDAKTTVFQGEGRDGFQIFIAPFSGGPVLTKERILEDLPSAIIEEPVEVLIGPNKDIRAILFWSEDPLIGRTREVWFVRGSHLYEITAREHMDELLAGIMSTWSFE